MSPNQPKTPISSFRLDADTKARIQHLAETMNTSMTEAVKTATLAAEKLSGALRVGGLDADRYPFDAYQSGMRAFREAMHYEAGEQMSDLASNAVQDVIAATWPIICASKIDDERRRTLVDVIQRLEGFQVEQDVVQHFASLLAAHDAAARVDQ